MGRLSQKSEIFNFKAFTGEIGQEMVYSQLFESHRFNDAPEWEIQKMKIVLTNI